MRIFRNQKTSALCLFIWMISLSLIFPLTTSNCTFAQCDTKLAGIDTLIDKTVYLLHHEQYDSALQICAHITETYPDNPMGYFGASVIYYGIMRTYWNRQFESEFDNLITLSIEKADAALKNNSDDAECYFILGACLGFRGLYRMKKGEWFSAFVDGLNGYRHLKTAFRLDNTLYDVYYGLGVFYYFKSVKAKALTFLRLMKDEREKGIEYIKIAIEKGRFAPLEGQFELIKIYYMENRFQEALIECRRIEYQFSENVGWIYLMAKIFDQQHEWNESSVYFNKLLAKLKASSYRVGNPLFVECHYGLAKSAYHIDNIPQALENSNKALDYAERRSSEKEYISSIVDYDEMLDELKNFNEQIKKSQSK